MSFIGRNLLIKIESKLHQVFPKNDNIPFGGRLVIYWLVIWNSFHLSWINLSCSWIELWDSFTIIVNVKDAIPTVKDYKLLMTHIDTWMLPQKIHLTRPCICF